MCLVHERLVRYPQLNLARLIELLVSLVEYLVPLSFSL
jgi:hypothetical protein